MGNNGRPTPHIDALPSVDEQAAALLAAANQQAQQPRLAVAPVPTRIAVGQQPGPDGNPIILIQVETPVGIAVYFLDPPAASHIGQQLTTLGQAGTAGLIVPQ